MDNQTIHTALFKFHTLIGTISKSSSNPFFKSKYASLPDILKAISQPLLECGLIIIHQLGENDTMQTSIVHCKTGASITSTFKLHIKGDDSQAWGSAITYAKRYAIGALLNLCIDKDDDGNASSSHRTNKRILQGTDLFAKAVAFLQDGGSMEAIQRKYIISNTTKNELIQAATDKSFKNTDEIR